MHPSLASPSTLKPSLVISLYLKPESKTFSLGLIIGLKTSFGAISMHASSSVPSLMNSHVCPKLWHLYFEHGNPFLPHTLQLSPPLGGCQGKHWNSTVVFFAFP